MNKSDVLDDEICVAHKAAAQQHRGGCNQQTFVYGVNFGVVKDGLTS